MDLHAISRLEAFDALRPEWDELRRSDTFATIFLSSGWLRALLAMTPHPWTIVTLREGGALVAAFPISVRPAPHRRLPVGRELTFASAPFADYQGMLCRPEYEPAAVARFAEFFLTLEWERAELPDVRDPRIAEIVQRLGEAGIGVHHSDPTPCSVIELPGDFDTYLMTLSKPTRRATLRAFKQMSAALPNWRASDATAADAGAHIEALLHVNALRWGGSAARKKRYRALFRGTFAEGCLRVTVFWDGDRPFAAGAAFVDPERSTYGAYLVGHDPAYGHVSPGKGILGSRIREAIEGGYRFFDFMRGGEAYKTSYATHEVYNAHYALSRRGARAALLRAVKPGYAALRSAVVRFWA